MSRKIVKIIVIINLVILLFYLTGCDKRMIERQDTKKIKPKQKQENANIYEQAENIKSIELNYVGSVDVRYYNEDLWGKIHQISKNDFSEYYNDIGYVFFQSNKEYLYKRKNLYLENEDFEKDIIQYKVGKFYLISYGRKAKYLLIDLEKTSQLGLAQTSVQLENISEMNTMKAYIYDFEYDEKTPSIVILDSERTHELDDIKDSFQNVELNVLGTARASSFDYSFGNIYEELNKNDGSTIYTELGYVLVYDLNDVFQRNAFFLCDPDFNTEAMRYKENQVYVISYGREIQWMQYNPNWRSEGMGKVKSRVGYEWNSDINEGTVYIYRFKYDWNKYPDLYRRMEDE